MRQFWEVAHVREVVMVKDQSLEVGESAKLLYTTICKGKLVEHDRLTRVH